jgi:hypothetical protein
MTASKSFGILVKGTGGGAGQRSPTSRGIAEIGKGKSACASKACAIAQLYAKLGCSGMSGEGVGIAEIAVIADIARHRKNKTYRSMDE